MINEKHDAPLRVLLMKGSLKDTWIAVCLERYIVAQGSSTDDVIREFKAMLAAEIIYWMMHATRSFRSPPLALPRKNTFAWQRPPSHSFRLSCVWIFVLRRCHLFQFENLQCENLEMEFSLAA